MKEAENIVYANVFIVYYNFLVIISSYCMRHKVTAKNFLNIS